MDFFCKTNKAALLHYLLEDIQLDDNMCYPINTLHIQDGMALLHVLKNLPQTFGEICLQILDHMVVKKDFIFSTDSYYHDSIKAQERRRRGVSEKIILGGPATRKPYNFKTFLENDENKKQLCVLMLDVWSNDMASTRLEQTNFSVLIVNGKAHKLRACNGKVRYFEVHIIIHSLKYSTCKI